MATKEELKSLFSTGKKPTGDDFSALIDGVEGAAGKDGSDGATGAPGKDGFGTEAQYIDLIARLDALETP